VCARARTALLGACVACCFAAAAPVSHAAFPGENGKIAFVSNRDGGPSDIWTIEADGTGLTRLTSTAQGNWGPRWSADGRKIAFERDYYVNNVLHQEAWRMNADGSGQTFVTVGTGPSWSPDGNKIVFARRGNDSEGGGVFVNDGVTETKIAPGGWDSVMPEWSPDGQKVVYTEATKGGSGYVYVVNADGTGNTQLTSTGNDYYGTWSPDGTKIAFTNPTFGPHDVWAMNANGSARSQLTFTPEDEYLPAWSPDGQKLAFGSQDGAGQNDILAMNADGTGIAHVTNDSASDSDPDWQPTPDASYARPKGATPMRASLVVAYRPCAAANDAHGAPLAFPSCAPPVQASDHLTIGAESIGSLRADVVPGNPATPQNEADVQLRVSVTDVRDKASLADYGGQLQASLPVRITDKDNPPAVGGPNRSATVSDTSLPATVPCAPTADAAIGSACTVTTTVNSLMPGAVKEGLRSIWALDGVRVFDGGADGVASTTGDNTLFETQGVFVP
jgi:Tol biopolymer transport system component